MRRVLATAGHVDHGKSTLVRALTGRDPDRLAEERIAGGYPLGREYPEHADGLLVAITERRSKEDIDRFAEALGRAVAAEAREPAGVEA